MAEIHVLDKHTAELIAAGEVVERPASVAKELLENAIDAGSTQITLSIRKGGIEQLQIADNGSGIECDSIDKAFIRHATSKIATAEDLTNIHTLGFRGEALASIASVARVELLTKTETDEFATLYRIEGGEPQGREPAARPTGTTITVNDLFYNTPARMKFLKKDASEGTFVGETVLHAALSHPEISFRFVRDGKPQFVTPGDGNLKSACYAVLGREFSRDLLPVDDITTLYHVTGLVTPPRACRASRSGQHFFVNGRYVKNRTMMAALEAAYKGTLMQGKYPGAVLTLTMPTDMVDVNVHPAKTEIRFSRESDVFDAVYRAVRQALAIPGSGECRFDTENMAPVAAETKQTVAADTEEKSAAAPAIKLVTPQPQKHFSTISAAEYQAMNQLTHSVQPRAMPIADVGVLCSEREQYNPLPRTANTTLDEAILDLLPEEETPAAATPDNETEEKAEAKISALSALPPETQQTSLLKEEKEPLRLVGEVFKTYIITERENEICLIDKHAAHERILYEKFAKDYGHVPSQMLLLPVQVNLSAEEKTAVLQNLELLADAGIEAEDYGGPTVAVRAVPADVAVENVEDMLVELAAYLAQGGRQAMREKTEWVLHSMACRAAIKAGDKNAPLEMLALAEKIMDGTVPPFCPHGRPCVLKITRKEMEKQFGRLG